MIINFDLIEACIFEKKINVGQRILINVCLPKNRNFPASFYFSSEIQSINITDYGVLRRIYFILNYSIPFNKSDKMPFSPLSLDLEKKEHCIKATLNFNSFAPKWANYWLINIITCIQWGTDEAQVLALDLS